MVDGELSNLNPRVAPARSLVLTLCAMAVAGVALGQPIECTNSARNVLRFENCGFDVGTAGWTVIEGDNATPNPSEGNPSAGSYQIDSVIGEEDGDRVSAIRSSCVLITSSSTYQVEAQFRIMDPSDAVQCGFFVAGYSRPNCTGAFNGRDSDEIRVTGSGWATLSDTYQSRPDDSSLSIFTFCYEDPSGPTFTMLMDNFIAAGPLSGSPIFSDGFESGDTSSWSRTVGPHD